MSEGEVPPTIKMHVIMFSTGISSAIVAERVLRKHRAILLFTDTTWEDEDNYRFKDDCLDYFRSQNYDFQLVELKDGRNPLQLFQDEGILGNDRMPVCSRKLKGELTVSWIKEQRDRCNIILYFGFDNTELHRAERVCERYENMAIECRFPLTERPYITDSQNYVILNWNVRPPRMYSMGFAHANCGGRCVRGKLRHWRHLLKVWPERFAEMEVFEKNFKGGNYTFLKGYSLEKLRKDSQSQLHLFDDSKGNVPCLGCV